MEIEAGVARVPRRFARQPRLIGVGPDPKHARAGYLAEEAPPHDGRAGERGEHCGVLVGRRIPGTLLVIERDAVAAQ